MLIPCDTMENTWHGLGCCSAALPLLNDTADSPCLLKQRLFKKSYRKTPLQPPPIRDCRDCVGHPEPYCQTFLRIMLQFSFRFFFTFFFFFRGFEKAAKFRRALGHFWTLQVWDIFFVVTILIYQELKWAEKMRRSPHKDHWLLFGNQSYWLIFLLPQIICF